MVVEALTALQGLTPVAALRASRWLYASVNGAHILGIVLLVGAIVPLDLRLMGWWRSVPICILARVLVPVSVAGLLLAVAAGAALFSARAVDYAETALFPAKMVLIVAAVANALLLRRAVQWEVEQTTTGVMPARRLRIAGAVSIVLWLAVIACGRLLAFVL